MSDIFPSAAHRTELLMRLKLLGVAKVIVEFAGSGDSGSIDLIRATTADGAVVGLDEDSQPLLKWVSYSSA